MTASTTGRRADGRIPELTSIRAFAAFAVCVTHAAFWTGGYTDDWPGRIAGRMEIGVTVFFVLSGFLLFRPWVDALAPEGGAGCGAGGGAVPPSLARYARHRVRRVLPGYWIAVSLVYLLDIWPPPISPDAPGGASRIASDAAGVPITAAGWEGFLRSMLFLQSAEAGWFHAGLSHMWSMVVEVGFYVALPLVGWIAWTACRGVFRPGILLACVVVFGLCGPAWTVATHHVEALPQMARLWPVGYFDWFAGGMLLAVLRRMGVRVGALHAWPVALAAFIVATTPVAGPATLVPDALDEALGKNILYLIVGVAALAPVALAPAGAPAPGTGWLRHPALVWLGEISYEFFLLHVLVLELAMPLMGYGLFQGGAVAACIVTTVLTVPAAWALRRVTDVLVRQPGPASPWRGREGAGADGSEGAGGTGGIGTAVGGTMADNRVPGGA